MDESKVEIEKVIVRDGYKIRIPMQEGAYASIENKGEHAIWFAFPIDRQGLFEVRPGQVLYLKGRSAHETEFIKKCALEDKYTCINEFRIGNQRIE